MEAPRHVLLQNIDDGQICTICQEDVSLADGGYALQCGHVFHARKGARAQTEASKGRGASRRRDGGRVGVT